MSKTGRKPQYTETQFQEVWRLRNEGCNSLNISKILGLHQESVYTIIARYGGITPSFKKAKERDGHLTLEERESISRGLAASLSVTSIAKSLSRSVCTISREIYRNGGKVAYRATAAHLRAQEQRKRSKPYKLVTHEQLLQHVIEKLTLDWSPEQIAEELPMSYPDDETMRISHETIYKMIYVQARGALKKELCAHLRSKRTLRGEKVQAKKCRIITGSTILS